MLPFLLVIVIWVIGLLTASANLGDGNFGDAFGWVSALFSGLAFAGLIVTLIMQREELELTRREFELTRKEFETQGKEFSAQTELIGMQAALLTQQVQSDQRAAFEATLFKLIDYWREYKSENVACLSTAKRHAFNFQVQRAVHGDNLIIKSNEFGDMLEHMPLAYLTEEGFGDILKPYFILAFRIMLHIENGPSEVNIEKQSYFDILRSHFSENDKILLMINARRYKNMREIIEKYGLLRGMHNDNRKIYQGLGTDIGDAAYQNPSYSHDK